MKIRPDWRARLEQIVGNRELAPASKAAGLNATYLRDVLQRNQTPQVKSVEKLSFALGVAPQDWFYEINVTDQQKEPSETPQTIVRETKLTGLERELDVRAMPRDLPVLGRGAGGKDGVFHMNGQPLDYARRPPRLAGIKDAYVVYVAGDSVSPWREDGDPVYVHPHAPVKPTDWVLVQKRPKAEGEPPEAYVKRLLRRTEREIKLLQYNPRKEISIKAADVISIHKILDWPELLDL